MKKILCLLLILAIGCPLMACLSGEGSATAATTVATEPVAEVTETATIPVDTEETTQETVVETEASIPAEVLVDTPEDRAEETTEEDTEEVTEDTGLDYILNTNTKKFHYPSCGSAAKIKDSNRKEFHGTREELIDMGYDPCGNCHP